MSIQLYETLFILDSTKLSAEPDGVKNQLHATLERYGSEILVSRPWDDRKLTYPIKKHKKGSYYIIYYKVDSLKQKEMERDFRINEAILRQMTSNIDPKWAEATMDVARNDTGAAFAIRGMQDEGSPGDIAPNLGDGVDGEAVMAARGGSGGRRGGRRGDMDKPE